MSWLRFAFIGAAAATLFYFGGRPREEQPLTFVAPWDLELTSLALAVFEPEGDDDEAQSGSSWSAVLPQTRVEQNLHLAPGRYALELTVTARALCAPNLRCETEPAHWSERHTVELDGQPRVIRLRGP